MLGRVMGVLQTAGLQGSAADLSRLCTQIICPAFTASHRLSTAASSASSEAATPASSPASTTRHSPTYLPDPCRVQVMVKAFELRYIQEASTVIRDLMLINMAPKSRNMVPTNQRSWPSDQTNLVIPISDVHIPTRLRKYTVLRSPHVDKKSREQFEKKVYKRCITVPTTSRHEIQSLVDSIMSYDFTGVQIQINVAHNTYLQPASKETRYGEVLSQHRQKNHAVFKLGELRYSSEGSSGDEDTLMAKLDAVTAAIPDTVARQRIRDLVGGINDVLLKLKLGTTVDDDAIVDAVGRILGPDGSVDPLKLQAVVKYGLFCKKLSEMLKEADQKSATATQLKEVFQAVSARLLEPTMPVQQQRFG